MTAHHLIGYLQRQNLFVAFLFWCYYQLFTMWQWMLLIDSAQQYIQKTSKLFTKGRGTAFLKCTVWYSTSTKLHLHSNLHSTRTQLIAYLNFSNSLDPQPRPEAVQPGERRRPLVWTLALQLQYCQSLLSLTFKCLWEPFARPYSVLKCQFIEKKNNIIFSQ